MCYLQDRSIHILETQKTCTQERYSLRRKRRTEIGQDPEDAKTILLYPMKEGAQVSLT